MKNCYGQHVFVTGASSGVGRACALAFAEAGCEVLGVSRTCREDTTRFPGGGTLTMKRMDVTDDASVKALMSTIDRIDIAILAAGLGIAGPAEEMPMDLAYHQMETNYFGVLRVGRAILPKMRAQHRGLLLVIGSVAGRLPIPMQCHYSSSKYALEAYVEAVRMEMRTFGVQATIIEPGDTRTGFTDARQTYHAPGSPYRMVCERSVAHMEQDERNGKPPETVAAVALRLARKGHPPVRVVVGLSYKTLLFLHRFLPDRLTEAILRKIYL